MYCIVLYCIVLYCIVLYCIVLYCIVLYCIVLYCIVLYCIVLYCIVLYCIVLYCIVQYNVLAKLARGYILIAPSCNFMGKLGEKRIHIKHPLFHIFYLRINHPSMDYAPIFGISPEISNL